MRVIACGRRDAVLANYKSGLKSHPDAICLLLVDAEGPVERSPWKHLRQKDRWQQPRGAEEEHCHLMVQAVEAWLIADPDTLAEFYGQHFNRRVLPRRRDVEAVPKNDLMRGLEEATRNTQKGRYHKIRHCVGLLEQLNADRVRERAKHCERLFEVLQRLLEEDHP